MKPHFNPDQPRVPAGGGRESGEWSDGAGIDIAGVKEWIARLALEAARRAARNLRPSKTKPAKPEVIKPESKPLRPPAPEQGISTPKPSDFVGQDFGTLGTAVEKPAIDIGEITGHAGDRITEYGQSFDDVQSIVSDPLIVLEQSDGRYYYLSDGGCFGSTRPGRNNLSVFEIR